MQRARLEPQLHPRQFECISSSCVWMAQLQSHHAPIPTHNTTDAVGITLTPKERGLGGIDHLHCFGLQLALELKNHFIQKGNHNRRRALLFSN